MEKQTKTAHQILIDDIFMAVCNSFRLPREHGYEIWHQSIHKSVLKNSVTSALLTIVVRVPEWGLRSYLHFSIERDVTTRLWYPCGNGYIALENHIGLPSAFRNTLFELEIIRKPVNYRNRWAQGAYPRIQIKRTRLTSPAETR